MIKNIKLIFIIFVLSMFIYMPRVCAMKIYVENQVADTLVLEVESSDMIEDVKVKIYQKNNLLLPENQELIFKDKIMEEGRSLADYNVQKENTIYLKLKNVTVTYSLLNLTVITNNVIINGNIDNLMVSSDKDFTAKLEANNDYKLPEIISVKIGGKLLDSKSYLYDSLTGEIFIAKEKIIGNINIEASAIKTSYKVIFDANGGNFKDSSEILNIEKWENGMENNLEIPTKDGFVFKGWYTSKTGGTRFEMVLNESGIDDDMTFYAIWEEKNVDNPPVLQEEVPKTGDNIIVDIILFICSLFGLSAILKFYNTKKDS